MYLRRLFRPLSLACLLGAGSLGAISTGYSAPLQVYSCCCHQVCPPCFVHCQEGSPKLKFKCGCPKPVCDPCMLDHFGYYRTCWQPWPFGPDWSHCPGPPPGALAAAQCPSMPPAGMIVPDSAAPLPEPRKTTASPYSSRSLYRDDGE